MPLDAGNFELTEDVNTGNRRIYICETGSVCIEDRHSRQTFSPEEFVALLHQIFRQTKGGESN